MPRALPLEVAVAFSFCTSPLSLASTAPTTPTFVQSWGNSGNAPGQFSNPAGVATDALGNVYVADQNNNRIQKFDRLGNVILQWGTTGSGNGQLNFPAGVAIDATGNVLVVDELNHRVQKFTNTGGYLAQWGSNGSGNGQFAYPYGIAIDPAGNVYVADQNNNRIQKFTSAGVYVSQWGTLGTGNGQFQYLLGVTTDRSGNVYVADDVNRRVQKFTSAGVYVTQWGSSGSGNGQFNPCFMIASDAVGNIYVVDNGNNRVEKFTNAGVYLTQWGSLGSGSGQFNLPTGIAVDAAGTVYVADQGNNRIEKFSGAGAAFAELPPTFMLAFGGAAVLNSPYGVAADAFGNVFVADGGYMTARVEKFSSTGALLTQWGSPGTNNGQFVWPAGLVTDASGNVYVLDGSTCRVQKFTTFGVYVSQWGGPGIGNGQFTNPSGIAIDAAGNFYVADTNNNRIQKFSAAGAYLSQWGTTGAGNGQFVKPDAVAVDALGNVYVADSGNNRIEKFSSAAVYVLQWGSTGSGNGQFNVPTGISADAAGNVFVVDQNNNRIQEFTSAGTYIGQRGSMGTGNGQFSFPNGVGVDAAGNVYVTDLNNSRISKFATPPAVAMVSDVLNDQGREARLRILRSSADSPASGAPVLRYDVYRRIDVLPGPTTAHSGTSPQAGLRLPHDPGVGPAAAELAGWEQVGSISARGDAEYNVVVPTLVDATSASLEYSAYFVSAATADPLTYFDSSVANGYSIDNLPPPAPGPFTAAYLAGATNLHWSVSSASDFLTFRLYRGSSATFIPGAGNLVTSTPDTGYVDPGGAGNYYKLSAVDWNGNESLFAILGPGQTTDVPASAPLVFALEGVRPNPSIGGRTIVSFSLPSAEPASLELIDIAGRRVIERAVGTLGAGRHAVDMAPAHALAPGMYFVRLTQGANSLIERITVLN
jgi:DNA-binding beta-propeller fold protein YncE